MLETLLFSIFLLLLAVVMVLGHTRSWRLCRESENAALREFGWRRYRRRMQVSTMVAIVALALPVGQSLAEYGIKMPWLFFGFWVVVLILVFWIAVLAMADFIAVRQHLSQVRHDQIIEEAKLRVQAREAIAQESSDEKNQSSEL